MRLPPYMSVSSARLPMSEVNIEVTMPSVSTTAKPRIGPVPNTHSTTPAMSVVMFESAIAENAFSKPARIGRLRRDALAHLLADALVDQHVGVDRHADGQDDAGDAGQRQRPARIIDSSAVSSTTLASSTRSATRPKTW